MGACGCINKTFLVIINSILTVFGVAVIAVASVAIHTGREYGELLSGGILTLPIWCLIVGIAITLLGLFGCCGVMWENSCMLYTYATVMTVLFLAGLTLGILVAVFPGKITGMLKKSMTKGFKKYEQNDSLKKGIDAMQHKFECCGVEGPEDWKTWKLNIPRSCCKDSTKCSLSKASDLYQKGCLEVMANKLKGVTLPLSLTAIAIAIVQVLCICIACALARKRSEYV